MLSLATAGNLSAAPLPMAGITVSELGVFDTTMQDYMQQNGISAGVAAIMKDGVPVYRRAFGWQDEGKSIPLRHDAIFRLASVTKPLTAAVIRNLIADGAIHLDDRVFDIDFPFLPPGLLPHNPFGTIDPRLASITVDHLLRHQGGWNRQIAGPSGSYFDLTYQERTIASEMGISSPPGRDATVQWIMGQPLQFDPGSERQYSNIGYLLLGLIAEEVTGKPLIDQFRQDLLTPLGVPSDQIVAGRTFQIDQDPREPFYDSKGAIASNVFFPDQSSEPTVEWAYGGWDHEARIGQGGAVADPLAILQYLDNYQVSGNGIGGPRPAPGGWKWNHTGSLTGTNALARERGDGVNYVVLFNKRGTNISYAGDMRSLFDGILDTGQIVSWPTEDLAALEIEAIMEGDFYLDGTIDHQDLTFWQSAFGSTDLGDSDNDEDSDGGDFLIWQRKYGSSPTPVAASQSVPEPATFFALSLAVILLTSCRIHSFNLLRFQSSSQIGPEPSNFRSAN